MDRSSKVLLVALVAGAVLSLLVWVIVAGGFDRPEGSGGWVYEYQTLIGVFGAVVAAGFTVFMMHREQRQARVHFERQMEVLVREDRLRVARESAILISQLTSARSILQRMPRYVDAVDSGYEKYRITLRTMSTLSERLDEERFASILSFLDDEFIRRRARLARSVTSNTGQLSEAFRAEAGARSNSAMNLAHAFGRDPIQADRAVEILEANRWRRFPQWERSLARLIGYLQDLRTDFGLRRLDRWGR